MVALLNDGQVDAGILQLFVAAARCATTPRQLHGMNRSWVPGSRSLDLLLLPFILSVHFHVQAFQRPRPQRPTPRTPLRTPRYHLAVYSASCSSDDDGIEMTTTTETRKLRSLLASSPDFVIFQTTLRSLAFRSLCWASYSRMTMSSPCRLNAAASYRLPRASGHFQRNVLRIYYSPPFLNEREALTTFRSFQP